MKPFAKSMTVALLIATTGVSAFADDRRGYSSHPYQGSYQSRRGGSDWVAPLLFLGIAGAVISAAASRSDSSQTSYVPAPTTYVPQAPVYLEPAVVVPASPPVNAWYFCRSVGQYYPYAQNCPEGWQAVYPPQR
jgi:hypothetical protein